MIVTAWPVHDFPQDGLAAVQRTLDGFMTTGDDVSLEHRLAQLGDVLEAHGFEVLGELRVSKPGP